MRLFTYYGSGHNSLVGLFKDSAQEEFISLAEVNGSLPKSLREIVGSPSALKAIKEVHSDIKTSWKSAQGISFAPLIPDPQKIICMGLNYADHAKEGGNARPDYPSFFMRVPSSLLGHLQPKENALTAIAGYSLFNDGSLRDYQRKTNQWTIGKNFDKTGGFGPCLVTPDELPVGAHGLRVQSRLNGKVMQDGNTKDFLWNVIETLVLISEVMTLEPGDVIISGTPAGVGYARTPPVFMQAGDEIEIEIDGVGLLKNTVQQEVL